jgi:hypothetical protein
VLEAALFNNIITTAQEVLLRYIQVTKILREKPTTANLRVKKISI